MVRALLVSLVILLAGCEAGPDDYVDLLGENAFAGAISNDGRVIVLGGVRGGIQLFVDGRLRHTLEKPEDQIAIEDAAISPDGRRIATASGNGYSIFSTESGRNLQSGTVPGLVKSIAVDNRGRLLMGTLQGAFWLSGDNNLLLSDQPTRAVALDGRRGIIGNDAGQVSLWGLGESRPMRQWQMNDAVTAVAIQGDQAAASSRGHATRLLAAGPRAIDAELAQEKNYYPTPVGAVAIRIVSGGVWVGNNLKRAAYWDFESLDEPAQVWRMPTRKGSNPGSARVLGFSRDERAPVVAIATGHSGVLTRD